MEDQVAAGLFILDGSTRVRTDSGLVRLSELSGSGPQGEQGVQGEQGPPGEKGDDGTVDTSNYYTIMQTNFALADNRSSASLSDGARTYDSNTHVIRNMLGTGGIVTHIFMNPADPEDSRNGSLVVNGDNVGGGYSIDPHVATFEDNNTHQAMLLKQRALLANKDLTSCTGA